MGWSTLAADLNLGTDKQGYGFGGTGKKSNNRQFDTYGEPFTMHDIIGCYLDYDSGRFVNYLLTFKYQVYTRRLYDFSFDNFFLICIEQHFIFHSNGPSRPNYQSSLFSRNRSRSHLF